MSGIEGLAGWFALPERPAPGRAAYVGALEAGESVVLADVQGAGCFRHLFFTAVAPNFRDLTLEAWWDDEDTPSVECPAPDFFGIGHGGRNAYGGDQRSLFLYTVPRHGYNSYFPMPFARRGVLRLRNDGAERFNGVYFQGDFHTYREGVATPLRFHASWRRASPAYRRAAPLTLLEAKGEGYLVGAVYHVHKTDPDDRWTHGGGDQLYIDGLDEPDGAAREAEPRFIHGGGGEDFYGGAWGLYPSQGLFAGAHHAHPLPLPKDVGSSWEQHEDGKYSMYRWYVDFPVAFRRSVRFAFGTMANEISATAYWYQGEPHVPLAALPAAESRRYGAPLAWEVGERPIEAADEWPVALLGPFKSDGSRPWGPESAPEWRASYETDLEPPYQDVVAAGQRVRWRTTRTRQHFIDFQAAHRAKRSLMPRGMNTRHYLNHAGTYVAAVLEAREGVEATLEVGFEDGLEVWVNRRLVTRQTNPRPAEWRVVGIPVRLERGRNEVVLWQTTERRENWSAWAALVRLRTAEGGTVPGVTVVPFDDLPPTLDFWREPSPYASEDGMEAVADDRTATV